MITKPLISVIMPFWNAEKYIAEAIESILNQTFKDFELILINDNSSDSSDSIVQKYLNDERVVYVKNLERKKLPYNYNYGLSVARADIVARMDGDDVAMNDRFEKQYNFLVENPDIAVVGSFIKVINEKGEVTGERKKFTDPNKVKEEFIIHSSLVHPSVMYRKNVVLSLGGYRELVTGEDIDLWYRIVFSGYKITNIPEYLLRYRIHNNSHTISSGGNKKSAIRQFKLRVETIKKFKLKLRLKDYVFIVGFLIVGFLFKDSTQKKLEGLFKKIIKI